MKDYDEVLKQLIECWSNKKEIKFFSILEDLEDEDINHLLDSHIDVPEMRDLIKDYKEKRDYLKNLK